MSFRVACEVCHWRIKLQAESLAESCEHNCLRLLEVRLRCFKTPPHLPQSFGMELVSVAMFEESQSQ